MLLKNTHTYKVIRSKNIFRRLFNCWDVRERQITRKWKGEKEEIIIKNICYFTGTITECESWIKLYEQNYIT